MLNQMLLDRKFQILQTQTPQGLAAPAEPFTSRQVFRETAVRELLKVGFLRPAAT